MELCAGQCRYLLCIYRMTGLKKRIRCVDIANDLGVTRPSVSKMIKCMVAMNLIYPDYCEAVRLTPEGKKIAEYFNKDYELTYAFFRKILKLSPVESKEQAFLFLSSFPAETVKKLNTVTSRSLKLIEKKRENAQGE